MAGKKAGRAVAGKRSGPKGPLPLGDTVHRPRPNTCVTALGERTTRLRHRLHDNGFLQTGLSNAKTVKRIDPAARNRGHNDFASLAAATRRTDRLTQDGRLILRLAPDVLGRNDTTGSGNSAHRLVW